MKTDKHCHCQLCRTTVYADGGYDIDNRPADHLGADTNRGRAYCCPHKVEMSLMSDRVALCPKCKQEEDD